MYILKKIRLYQQTIPPPSSSTFSLLLDLEELPQNLDEKDMLRFITER
jgi:hypothetical protein